jgi:hypothetical protein
VFPDILSARGRLTRRWTTFSFFPEDLAMKNLLSRPAVVAALFLGMSFAVSPAAATTNESEAAIMAGLNAAAKAKLAVSEKRVVSGQWVESNEAAGFVPAPDAPAKINIGSGGAISVLYTTPAELEGASIVLTPSAADAGVVNWSCEGSGIPAELLPQGCK